MHLGNGAITPECGAIALGAAAAGAGVAWVAARAAGLDRAGARTAGALGAAVFAAQLFNVQILPFSSVHLIGGVLLAWIVGPALGLLTMTGILILQALLLGDGGLLALGANIVNMGMLPAAAVALVKRRFAGPAPARTAVVLGGTALLATLAGALLIVAEVAVGRSGAELEGLGAFAARMLWTHALAGVIEGAATIALVAMLVGLGERRADGRGSLGLAADGLRLSLTRAVAVVAVSLAVALLSAPALGLASAAPDGYEAALSAANESGYALGRIEAAPQLAGWSAHVQSWQEAIVSSMAGPEAVVLVLATLLAGAAAWGCGRLCARGGWQAAP